MDSKEDVESVELRNANADEVSSNDNLSGIASSSKRPPTRSAHTRGAAVSVAGGGLKRFLTSHNKSSQRNRVQAPRILQGSLVKQLPSGMSEDEVIERNQAEEKYEPIAVNEQLIEEKMRKNQQLSLHEQLHIFSYDSLAYSVYLTFSRIRLGYALLLTAAILFVLILGFTMSLFFNVLLDEAREAENWELRAAFMLASAPVVLIIGCWLTDDLTRMIGDAIRVDQLRDFRVNLATFFHVLRHWKAVGITDEVKEVLKLDRQKMKDAQLQDLERLDSKEHADALMDSFFYGLNPLRYPGPPMDRSTLVLVDLLVPILLEVIPLAGLLEAGIEVRSFSLAVANYVTWSVFTAFWLVVTSLLLEIFMSVSSRYALAKAFFDECTPYAKVVWVVPQVADNLKYRVLNMGRYLLRDGSWASQTTCCPTLMDYIDLYHHRVPFWLRVVADIGAYALISLLFAYAIIPSGVAWVLLAGIMWSMGSKVKERLPQMVSTTYSAMLLLVTVFMGLLFCFSLSNMAGFSSLDSVSPPVVAGASGLIVRPLDSTLSVGYPVCRKSWGGLSAIDMAMLSEMAYSASTQRWYEQAAQCFGNTAIANVTLLYEAPSDRVIHYKHVYFSDQDLHVVTMRGTSTHKEVWQDIQLYVGIATLQMLGVFLPVYSVLPASVIQGMLYIVALPELSAPATFQDAVDYVANLKTQGRTVVVTGHSLGGMLAGLIGAKNGVPAVAFSPPGLYYVHRSVSVSLEDIREWVVNIVPFKDVVPLVDRQIGSLQLVECEKSTPQCHQAGVTMCTMVQKCGDARQRQFFEYCKDRFDGFTRP